ncbi:MAG: membrane protein insertase YidC, partial [Boseongicola sp. SB0664_bin_43]|nr:membrane protein insertase YidC [Boseongicola sp. SB0664_bin_43]
GVSMWMQQKLNPAPTDPTQQMIFAWMPWIFMFMLGSFASGLVIYWIANNVITFAQQYIIMRGHGYRPDIWGNIRGTTKPEEAAKTKSDDASKAESVAGEPTDQPSAKPANKPARKRSGRKKSRKKR